MAFSYVTLEGIPLKMNLAVIAHEIGHAIFDYYVFNKDSKLYLGGSSNSLKSFQGLMKGLRIGVRIS